MSEPSDSTAHAQQGAACGVAHDFGEWCKQGHPVTPRDSTKPGPWPPCNVCQHKGHPGRICFEWVKGVGSVDDVGPSVACGCLAFVRSAPEPTPRFSDRPAFTPRELEAAKDAAYSRGWEAARAEALAAFVPLNDEAVRQAKAEGLAGARERANQFWALAAGVGKCKRAVERLATLPSAQPTTKETP